MLDDRWGQGDPGVAPRFVDGNGGWRKRWVGEGADGDGDTSAAAWVVPEDGCAAVRAEAEAGLAAFVAGAGVFGCAAGDC